MLLCILARTLSPRCLPMLPDPTAPDLPARATCTHQHTSPRTACHSLHLHALTLSLCSQTEHSSSVSVVPSGNSGFPSAAWTTQMCHSPVTNRKRAFCHHRASIPHWNPSAPSVFTSEKSYLFLALSNSYLLQDDISLTCRRAHLPSINPRNYLPSFPK